MFFCEYFEILKKLILKKISERLLLNNAKRNTLTGVSFLINISCGMQLKPIFTKKEVPTLVFSRQSSEIFNNNFFKERKKALL